MGPSVILVRPQMGENIGAAARVMANFGLTDLRLVAPRDGWPNGAADMLSAGAFDRHVAVSVFDTTGDAAHGLTRVAAATARGRDLPTPVYGLPRMVAALDDVVGRHGGAQGGAGVMFGPEASGLDNEDIALADMIVSYPVNTGFPSLNLAQAVGVFAYAWGARNAYATGETGRVVPSPADAGHLSDGHLSGGHFGADPAPRLSSAQEPVRHPMATKDQIAGLHAHLAAALDRAGFFFPPEKADGMRTNLRAMLTRQSFTHQEVQTLRGAIKAIEEGPRRRALELMMREKLGLATSDDVPPHTDGDD